MCFLSNLGCKIIFLCSVNFWHQQDSNSLLKEHWSRDFLVQIAYCKWTNGTIYSQACLFQDSLIHFWCAVLECKIPCCLLKKGFPSVVAYSMPWKHLVQITPTTTRLWQQGWFEAKAETEICTWIDGVYLTALIWLTGLAGSKVCPIFLNENNP